MKPRTLVVLAGVLLLLVLVAVLAERSERARHAPSASGRLLPAFTAAKAVKLEIRTSLKTETLIKKEGEWKVEPEAMKADAEGVREALEKLEKVEKVELASQNPAKHAALEVKEDDEHVFEVKVWSEGEPEPSVRLFLGRSGPDFASNYVRLAGQDAVYRTSELIRPSFDRGTRGWRDRTVLKFDAEQATRVELESPSGTLVLERPEAEDGREWRLGGTEPGPADQPAAEAVVRALSSLEADDFAVLYDDFTTGMLAPSWRSRVALKDGRTFELLWGKELNGKIHVRHADGDVIYLVLKYKRDSVFPEAAKLRAKPSPTPEAMSSPGTEAAATPAAATPAAATPAASP